MELVKPKKAILNRISEMDDEKAIRVLQYIQSLSLEDVREEVKSYDKFKANALADIQEALRQNI